MSGGGGGGGGGVGRGPQMFKGGHNIKCPPPPHDLGLYDYSLKRGPFFHVSSSPTLCGLFFLCVCVFVLLVKEVGDVWWVPLLCVWKIDPKILSSEKKSDGVPPISFFGTCATFEAGGGPLKKQLCPPMVWFGLTPMTITLYNTGNFKAHYITQCNKLAFWVKLSCHCIVSLISLVSSLCLQLYKLIRSTQNMIDNSYQFKQAHFNNHYHPASHLCMTSW